MQRAPRLPFRSVALLGYDALAAFVAMQCALLLCVSGGVPATFAATVKSAVPLLLAIRLVATVAARLHRWSFSAPGYLDYVRLSISMAAASLAFLVVCPGLPSSFYVLDFFLATSLMAAFRSVQGVAGDFFRTRFPQAKAQFLAAEFPRRVLNIAVAAVALVVSLPLWILIAAAIRLTSRGPVFYKQERIGLDLRSYRHVTNDPRRKRDLGGRPFMMYKFRTMRVDAEASTGAVWCAKNDDRVTPVGRLLRHTRLDELPQLVNVLKGDMNVVGPRPERPSIFAELREQIPNYQRRQRVRPGITGHAQVNLEYDASMDDVARKVKFDLEYLSRASVEADLAIMAKTIPVMLLRDRILAARAEPEEAGRQVHAAGRGHGGRGRSDEKRERRTLVRRYDEVTRARAATEGQGG